MEQSGSRPRIALATGDPAGTGPEFRTRQLADAAFAAGTNLGVIGGPHMLTHRAPVTAGDFGSSLPPDTAFLRAGKGVFDAVLMLHHNPDQMTAMLPGGLPVPACTPAHGSTRAMAEQGIANPDTDCAAGPLPARMAGS
jgi:4-hydroxy-L-threonine phosphate dehydrogenase PdxA